MYIGPKRYFLSCVFPGVCLLTLLGLILAVWDAKPMGAMGRSFMTLDCLETGSKFDFLHGYPEAPPNLATLVGGSVMLFGPGV